MSGAAGSGLGSGVLEGYAAWLTEERGYAAETVASHVAIAGAYARHCASELGADERAGAVEFVGAERARGLAPASVRHVAYVVRTYHAYLRAMGLRTGDAAAGLELLDGRSGGPPLGEGDVYTAAQLEGLRAGYPLGVDRDAGVDAAGKPTDEGLKGQRRGRVAVDLLVRQGLTAAEAAGLVVGEVDLAGGTIYVRGSPRTRARRLPLGAQQAVTLHGYLVEDWGWWCERTPGLAEAGDTAPLLFGVVTGEALAARAVRRVVNRGRPPDEWLAPQRIRRTVIAGLLADGHDVRVVQALAGHVSAATTEEYVRKDAEDLAAAVRRWHPRQ